MNWSSLKRKAYKWYEKSSKRKVNYKRSFKTGSSKVELFSPEWKSLSTLWIRNRVDAKSGYLYTHFFFRWRNEIQPSSLPLILYSRWQPRSQVFSLALNSALTRLRRTLPYQYSQRSSGYQRECGNVWTGKFYLKMDTCGRGNFWIGKEKLQIQKYPDTCGGGLEWTLGWLAIQWAIAKYSSIWPIKLHTEPIRLRYINAKCTNSTYVKARPKRMAAVIFRDTETNRFH